MRALRLTDFADPDGIRVSDVERPNPLPGEALIKVAAAGLNPSDVKNAQGAMKHHTSLPRILGRDYAGTVVEGPSEWIGKDVWGTGGERGFTVDGSFAEYMSVTNASLREKPFHLTMLQAAIVGVPFVTAYAGLIDLCQAKEGETVLIVGASGAVGTAVAELARWKGLKLIGTARSSSDVPKGEMTVVNLEKHNLTEFVRSVTNEKGADVCYNAVGGTTFEPALKSLAIHGRVVCISATDPHEVTLDVLHFYRNQLKLYGLDTLQIESEESGAVLENMRSGFDSGALTVADPEAIPLEDAAEAFARVAAGEPGKKALIPSHP